MGLPIIANRLLLAALRKIANSLPGQALQIIANGCGDLLRNTANSLPYSGFADHSQFAPTMGLPIIANRLLLALCET
jgi:hypothetical protein